MTTENHPRYVVVAGPTASGKSALAMAIAEALGGEIISCDSVQLYRGFDIGSAKPTAAEQARIPHHLIDVVDCHEDFDARRYEVAAGAAIAAVAARGRLPVVVGGTGLYLRALWGESWHGDLPKDDALRKTLASLPLEELQQRLSGLDPERARALHPNDRFRISRAIEIATLSGGPVSQRQPPASSRRSSAYMILMTPDRAVLHQRIAERASLMLEQGLVQEVQGLLARGCSLTCKPMQSIGYREVVAHLQGDLPREKLAEAVTIATRQYAKRQDTWFRKTTPDMTMRESDLTPEIMQAIQHFWRSAGL